MKNATQRSFINLFLLIAFIISFSGNAFAQDDSSATIVGQVVDSAGAIVPNATVVVRNTATGQTRQVQTNSTGQYTVFPLNPGDYEVSVEQSGFKKSVVSLTLSTRDRRPVDIVLEVGDATETVIVTDEPPLIQESSTGQTLVSGNQVTELPLNNRNFIRLLETIPGVSSSLDDESNFGLTSRADVSINGLRRNSVNYVVDGVSNVDVGSNITLLSTPTVDSIQEFKVLSSNYTAEIGRSAGGAVIITTRGGGNDFHGSLYEFTRNDAFNANSFFNNRLGRNTDGSPRAEVPKLRYHNFGGTFSGPIYFLNFGEGGPLIYSGKNKTFFFVSSEARRIKRATTDASVTVPTALERQGNFSQTLGLSICQVTNPTTGAVTFANATAANACPTNGVLYRTLDTAGELIQVRRGHIFRPSDNRPYAGNIIPLSDIDPRSLGLLNAFPLPNIGTNGFTYSPVNINNTRQEVVRIDHNFTSNHKIFGRYTQDLSQTEESFGLFNNITLPNVSTTDTKVPGKVMAASWTGLFGSSIVNELTYNYSTNTIASDLIGRGRKSDYPNAGSIVEFYDDNPAGTIPLITTRYSSIGSTQGYSIEYGNSTIRDVLTWTRGNHILKFGGELTFEFKNENLGGNSAAGSFGFSTIQSQGYFGPLTNTGATVVAGTGDSFGSFLLGRANTYSESEFDPRVRLRFGRREFFVQDTWKVRPNLTLDLGVRYQYFLPPTEVNDFFVSFDPELYSEPTAQLLPPSTGNVGTSICANQTCTVLNSDVLDPLNGIAIAGVNSRFGRSIIPKDKNNFSPRVGLAYSPEFENGFGKFLFGTPGQSVIRLGYGFYYDQTLIGIFENATFFTPPINNSVAFTSTVATAMAPANTITFSLPSGDPAIPAGQSPDSPTYPARSLGTGGAIAPDFKTPETQVWSIGIQREIFKNAVIDLSYVGTKADHLIRQTNINFVSPQAVLDEGASNINRVRPYKGWGDILYYETTSKSRYHGFLSSFNYRLAKGFTITAAYTFSKTLTDSTNDRDAVDRPQNPFNLRAEYAEARTSRPHIFSASYVYEIPFFRSNENSALRLLLGGWQVSGITNIESGAPVPRVTVASTNNLTRGLYPDFISDPNGGLAGTIDPVTGLPFIFDPEAFAPAADGQFGNSGRSFARLPGRNQTNLALMKQFYFNTERTFYLQLRAESYNLFNHTQFIGVNTTLPTAGPLSNTTFGRPTATRLPREFQFGAKLYF